MNQDRSIGVAGRAPGRVARAVRAERATWVERTTRAVLQLRRRLAVVLAAGLLAGLLLAIAAPVQAQTVRLRFAHSLSTNEPFHEAAEFFARNVAQRSNGGIAIEVFPSEQLGSLKETMEMIRQGAGVIVSTDSGYLADFVPDFGILNGPYLIRDQAEFRKLLASDWYRELVEKARGAGFQVLAFNWFFGARHIIADRPVRRLDDFKGLSIRVPPVPMFIETFKSLGARGVTLNFSEVYNGLQQRVVEAAEAPLPTLYGVKLHEVAKTVSLTSHFVAYLGLSMNRAVFDRLTAEQRTILLEEAARAGEHMAQLTEKRQQSVIAEMESKGVKFVRDVDVAAFQRATEPVYKAFPKWTPGLHDRVRGILAP
ncbi:MAG: C4-dicarboxylate TRAP transporter substrate-binding protein [Lautropia sp.]